MNISIRKFYDTLLVGGGADKPITYPKEWQPTNVHLKSGWKNNPKVLSEIVNLLNDEIYIEDENEMMEKIDVVLEYLKQKYIIKNKKP